MRPLESERARGPRNEWFRVVVVSVMSVGEWSQDRRECYGRGMLSSIPNNQILRGFLGTPVLRWRNEESEEDIMGIGERE